MHHVNKMPNFAIYYNKNLDSALVGVTSILFQRDRIRGLLRQITALSFQEPPARPVKSFYSGQDVETETPNGNQSPIDKVGAFEFPITFVLEEHMSDSVHL
jgi:hypothetical protein